MCHEIVEEIQYLLVIRTLFRLATDTISSFGPEGVSWPRMLYLKGISRITMEIPSCSGWKGEACVDFGPPSRPLQGVVPVDDLRADCERLSVDVAPANDSKTALSVRAWCQRLDPGGA